MSSDEVKQEKEGSCSNVEEKIMKDSNGNDDEDTIASKGKPKRRAAVWARERMQLPEPSIEPADAPKYRVPRGLAHVCHLQLPKGTDPARVDALQGYPAAVAPPEFVDGGVYFPVQWHGRTQDMWVWEVADKVLSHKNGFLFRRKIVRYLNFLVQEILVKGSAEYKALRQRMHRIQEYEAGAVVALKDHVTQASQHGMVDCPLMQVVCQTEDIEFFISKVDTYHAITVVGINDKGRRRMYVEEAAIPVTNIVPKRRFYISKAQKKEMGDKNFKKVLKEYVQEYQTRVRAEKIKAKAMEMAAAISDDAVASRERFGEALQALLFKKKGTSNRSRWIDVDGVGPALFKNYYLAELRDRHDIVGKEVYDEDGTVTKWEFKQGEYVTRIQVGQLIKDVAATRVIIGDVIYGLCDFNKLSYDFTGGGSLWLWYRAIVAL